MSGGKKLELEERCLKVGGGRRVGVSLSLPAPPASRRLRRGRPPFASWRPPPSPSPAPPLPRKRVSGTHREDAEADGAVVDEGAEAKEQLERGDGEYVSSVGTNFSLPLPARLRVARAAPGGDPVFFLLAAVAVTTCVAFTGMVVVAIPTMLLLE
uniref:Uncharacterized protein n=1 Tax=Setaria italica TaxID=4555 RepID=K3ZE23_SETIT